MVRAGRCSFRLSLALVGVLASAAIAWGQPAPVTTQDAKAEQSDADRSNASPEEQAASQSPSLEASELDTYLLKDSKGNLVPVLGLSFEEFERLIKIKRGLAPAAPPNFTLDTLSVSGSVEKSSANVQVSASVRVREAGWVRIPLKMNGAVLRHNSTQRDKGDYFITADSDENGYACWLRGETDSKHEIKLQFAIPVEQVGDEHRLGVVLPRATEGSLRLEVPMNRAEAFLRNDSDGLVSTKAATADKSEITVLGAAGDLQLAWRPGRQLPAAGPNVLEASGEVIVRVEGRTRIRSEAKLRVRNFGAPLDTFRVRIPPGMEFTPAIPTGYTVTAVEPPLATATSNGGQLVEIKLDRPASSAVEVRLDATLASGKSMTSVEPASWEVIGAARQRGTIDAHVDGDWHLQWIEESGVRRIDTPPAAAGEPRIAARFEYYRQPCTLKLQVSPRPTRISVEPTYVVFVDAQQTRLEATLRYRIRGSKASTISIDPGDWQFDRIASDSNIDSDAILTEPGKPWQLPLQETAGNEFEVKIEAHRPSPMTGEPLYVTLPRPLGEMIAPATATVVVLPADNVQLIPNTTAIRGLTPDQLPASIRLPQRQQSPLVFRDLGGSEPVQFAAQFQVRSRKTSVDTESLIQIDRQQMQIEQRLSYRIAFEPQRTFELRVPTELQRESGLHVVYGEDFLPLEPLSQADESSDTRLYYFVAPSDQIGACEFFVRYTLPLPSLPAGQATPVRVPLTVPADYDESEFSNHSMIVTYSDELQLDSIQTGQGGRAAVPRSSGSRRMEIPLLQPVQRLECQLQPIEGQQAGTTQVAKAWFQTWLSPESREDRAVWRFTPLQNTIRVQLPHEIGEESGRETITGVQAAINGRPAHKIDLESATVRIELPPTDRDREIVLELWYTLPRGSSNWSVTTTTLQPPVLAGDATIRRLYWHVCTPGEEHLLVEPADFAAELTWSWNDLFWARRATLDQDDLERWIGASSQDAPPAGINQYLFSGFGRVPQLRLVTASQRFLAVVIPAIVLALGLVLIHVRQARNPALLLLLAAVLGGLGIALPEMAVFVGQAAVVGVVVVLAASLWTWLLRGRALATTPSSSTVTPLQLVESKSTEIPSPRVERASPPSASTAPLGMAAEPRP